MGNWAASRNGRTKPNAFFAQIKKALRNVEDGDFFVIFILCLIFVNEKGILEEISREAHICKELGGMHQPMTMGKYVPGLKN